VGVSEGQRTGLQAELMAGGFEREEEQTVPPSLTIPCSRAGTAFASRAHSPFHLFPMC